MLPRRAAAGALLLIAFAAAGPSGCAATPAPWHVPEADLRLADDPPPPPAPPSEGAALAPASRRVTLLAVVGDRRARLDAWCRVGVWTTLADLEPVGFVVRETWGRLGTRRPRLLLRVHDQVLAGVTVRVRPDETGGLSFHAEVAGASVGEPDGPEEWAGIEVALARPRRHGYRFSGAAGALAPSLLASWGDRLRITLLAGGAPAGPGAPDAPPARPGVRFTHEGVPGFVAGRAVRFERFVEEWVLAPRVEVVADGIRRREWRLAPDRGAAGFALDGSGALAMFGTPFRIEGRAGA